MTFDLAAQSIDAFALSGTSRRSLRIPSTNSLSRKISLCPSGPTVAFSIQHLGTFADFWRTNVPVGRPEFTLLAVQVWTRRSYPIVNVLFGFLTTQWILNIGNFGPFFNEMGRQGDWIRTLLISNPASDDLPKQYPESVTQEKLQARIAPKPSTSIFQYIGVDLRPGYLFRCTSPQGSIFYKPFFSSTAESRLKFYLGRAKSTRERHRISGCRSGCALTLAFPSSSDCHGCYVLRRLESSATTSYHMKLADILPAGAPADALLNASLPVIESSRIYMDYNHLQTLS